MIKQIWQVWDGNNKVFEGSLTDVCVKYNISESTVLHSSRLKKKLRNGLYIVKGESKRQAYLYQVKFEGETIFVGNNTEVARYIHKAERFVRDLARTNETFNGLSISRKIVPSEVLDKKRTFTSKQNKKFNYLVRALSINDNTIISRVDKKTLTTLIEELNEIGIKVHYRYVIDKLDGNYWVIEKDETERD